MQIKTIKLQELVSKAVKGVGNNKLKPITELICIKVENNLLTLITTDYDNFMYVSEDVESEDFYAVVQANQFVKLISRLTSENTSLDVVNNCLEVRANGTYRIPVEIDANSGKIIDYTNPVADLAVSDDKKIGQIESTDVKTLIRALKPSLAVTVDIPQYVNYYVADTVLATDTNVASCYGKAITDKAVAISAPVVDMLDVYSGDAPIDIYLIDNRLLFRGDHYTLLGYAMPGVESYAVDSISNYVNTEYPYKCKVVKQELLQALDRLSLFVGEFDDDTVAITFAEDGLQLSSKQSDSVETLPYIESESTDGIQRHIYLEMLRSQVKAQTGDAVTIYHGEPNSIKLVDDKVTAVVCLVM